MDRISVGQEMILVRSRKKSRGSEVELDSGRGSERCLRVRTELARWLRVNGNVCTES